MSKDTEYGTVREGQSTMREVTKKNKKAANAPAYGWYRHKESGERAIVQGDPLWGNTQAQAFVQCGFEYEREATPDEIKSLPEMQAEVRSADAESLKGLVARVNVLEGVADENTQLKAKIAELEAQKKADDEEKAEFQKQLEEAQATAKQPDALDESAKTAKANAVAETDVREKEKAAKGNAAGTSTVAVAKAQKEGK